MKKLPSAKKKNKPQLFQEIALWVALIMSLVHLIKAITEILKFSNKKNIEE